MNNEWSRQMGEKHGRRNRAGSLAAQTIVDRERERHAACLERWPALVSVMKEMVASYNAGAGVAALTLVEDAMNHGVTLTPACNGGGSLVITLDGVDVSVCTRDGHSDSTAGLHWVSLNRTNEDAAAYLLRQWMERL